MRSHKCFPALAGSAILLWASGAALAQAIEAAGDEIVVTARKREETLQDVPLSVAAVTL